MLAFRPHAKLGLLLLLPVAGMLGNKLSPQKAGGEIVPTAAMHAGRSGQTATLLRDGTVLIAGGMLRNGDFLASAETYDPTTDSFTPTKDMLVHRVGAAAARLSSGKVLIVGGWSITDEAEVYDPGSRSFTALARMNQARARPTATLLHDGKVLITGGEVNGDTLAVTATAELFDEHTGKFTTISPMYVPRAAHTATVLQDGRVLVVGGASGRGQITDTAEIYDPAKHSFAVVGRMSVPRYKHSACLLENGEVLVVGGSDSRDWNGSYDSAEIFNPKGNAFEPTGKMAETRFKLPPEAALLNGKVLIFGGARGAALYDEKTKSFTTIAGSADTERFYPSATTLKDGRVLLAGGYPRHSPYDATRSAWLFVSGK